MIHNYLKFLKPVLIGMLMLPVLNLVAQPDAMNYQTVVRDGAGQLLTNENITLRFSVRSGASDGTIVYQESHDRATNDQGLVNVIIGRGFNVSGSLSDIQWGQDDHYLEVEIDVGSGFVNMGTQQLVSVPYAMSAIRSDSAQTAIQSENADHAQSADQSDTAQYAYEASPAGNAGGDLSGMYPNPNIGANAVSASEIEDEPGVVWKKGVSFFSLANTTGNQKVDSVTISTPDAGYVVAKASGYVNVAHGNSLDNIGMNVTTNPEGESIFTHGVSSFKILSSLPVGSYREPFSCLRVFEVDGTTDLKIYLIVRQVDGANIASTDVAYPVIQATYYPTDYFPTILFPIKKSTGATQPISTDGSDPER